MHGSLITHGKSLLMDLINYRFAINNREKTFLNKQNRYKQKLMYMLDLFFWQIFTLIQVKLTTI